MEYNGIQKAWVLNKAKFSEPWFVTDEVFYGTRGEAKTKALKELCYNDTRDRNGRDYTFLNVPIIRDRGSDLLDFNGKPMTRSNIEYYAKVDKKNAEFDKLLKDNPDSYAYIKKRGSYYRPNCSGYTDERLAAGVYTLEKAVSECKNSELSTNMHPVLINIEEHNAYINKHIENFKTKLIWKN